MADEDHSDDGRGELDFGDAIDATIFEQILEMDDDEDERDFSRQIVLGFFEQARGTFEEMYNALEDKNLPKLSDLGHFLKGSSATLGLTKVKDSCEKIQNWGNQLDDNVSGALDDEEYLGKIRAILPQVERDCADAERKLKRFYGES